MNFKETAYWTLYADIVNFHRRYAAVREDDPYWQQVVDEATALYKKYESVPEKEFAKSLILCILNELERLDKERRSKNNGKYD